MRDRVFKTGLGILQISRTTYTISSLLLSLPPSCDPAKRVSSVFFSDVLAGLVFLSHLRIADSSRIIHIRSTLLNFFFSLGRSRISVGTPRDIEWFIDLFRKRLFNRAVQWLLPIVRLSPGWPLFWSDLFGPRLFPFFLCFLSRSLPAMKFVMVLTRVLFAATRCCRSMGKARRIFQARP